MTTAIVLAAFVGLVLIGVWLRNDAIEDAERRRELAALRAREEMRNELEDAEADAARLTRDERLARLREHRRRARE